MSRLPKTSSVVGKFAIGDRVQLSELGRARCPRFRVRLGEIVGYSLTGVSLRVVWSGNVSPSSLHHSYLETVADI